ncbi:efflux RND transporter periplasmic adaptor subunit [Stakelama sediminis]|nr:efflux RND transporter periplasmic adaptor subunit [Stakelama sediminis]
MDRRVAPARGWWRNRRVRWGLIAAAVLAAVALLYAFIPSSNALAVEADAIRTGTVQRAPFQDYVPLRAEVTPRDTTYVSAIVGGQVDHVIAGDGSQVAKGQPLAVLSNRSLELDVASRSADIAGQLGNISAQRLSIQRNRLDSDSEVASAKNALQKAQVELSHKQFLLQKGIVNQAAVKPLAAEVAYQQSRVQALTTARAQESGTLASQSAQIGTTAEQLRRSLAMVHNSLDALTIRAPMAGRLTGFDLQPGQTLNPGDRVAQIDAEGSWKLIADVDQYYLGRVRIGQNAIATLDNGQAKLRVSKVLPQVTDGRFRVELTFDGTAPAGLNRGQTLDVRLILGADHPAIVAPAGSWLDAGGNIAFVLTGKGRAERRQITTGRRNPDQVEVTSGLKPGDRIVTSAINNYQQYQHLLIS